MTEQAILDQLISREAEKERREILSRAKGESEKIRSQAEEEARRARARHQPVFQARGDLARQRLIHQAQFETQIQLTTEKQKVVEAMLAQVAGKLQEVSKKPEYRALLQGLLQEALALADQPVRVQARQEDLPLVKDILHRIGKGTLEVVGDLRGWGGVRLSSVNGQVTLDNTLESRFAKAQEVFKEEIAKDLFS